MNPQGQPTPASLLPIYNVPPNSGQNYQQPTYQPYYPATPAAYMNQATNPLDPNSYQFFPSQPSMPVYANTPNYMHPGAGPTSSPGNYTGAGNPNYGQPPMSQPSPALPNYVPHPQMPPTMQPNYVNAPYPYAVQPQYPNYPNQPLPPANVSNYSVPLQQPGPTRPPLLYSSGGSLPVYQGPPAPINSPSNYPPQPALPNYPNQAPGSELTRPSSAYSSAGSLPGAIQRPVSHPPPGKQAVPLIPFANPILQPYYPPQSQQPLKIVNQPPPKVPSAPSSPSSPRYSVNPVSSPPPGLLSFFNKPPPLKATKYSDEEIQFIQGQTQQTDFNLNHQMEREELVRLFGMMGRVLGGEQKNDGTKSLFDFLFNAITRKKANKLSSVDWESNWIPLKQADEEERLKFGFDLLDFRGTGKLALEDFVDIIRAAHSTLAIVGLSAPVLNSYNFATYFFNLLSNGKPFLTFNDFKHSFPRYSRMLGTLGFFYLPKKEAYPSKAQPNRGDPTTLLCNLSPHSNIVFSLMMGIQLSLNVWQLNVGNAMGGGIVGAVDDFNEESLYRLPGIVDKLNILKDNEFTDFATGVFIKIRNLMGIPTEEYLLSTGFTQFIGNIMLGKNTSYTVSTSAGKSGSLFFTTADSRYLIKTIPAREALSVQRILPNYFKYLQENRNTFLNKIVGFHKYGSIHFIVLENILDSNLEIHRLYDLKGSTQGRINTTGAGPLKDLDLIKSEVYIELSDRNKLLFLDQILKDTKFLEENGIIDYSLLFGIHKLGENKTPVPELLQNTTKVIPFYREDFGGMLSRDNNYIYFFGIIDILTTYDLRKRGETMAKRLFLPENQKSGISCVPPQEYSTRFFDFVKIICK